MREPAGNCLSCGRSVHDQSYCDECEKYASEKECPECGDRYESEEPLTDCLDHIEDGDLRTHIRTETDKMLSRHAKQVDKLYNQIAAFQGQVVALEMNIAKKDGQLMELFDAVRFLKNCLDEKKEAR